jgi:hypothetical protein
MDTEALIAGSVVSVVIELLKRYGKLNTAATYIALAILSVGAAAVYVNLKGSAWGPSLVQILTVSQTIYALLLRQVPQQPKT